MQQQRRTQAGPHLICGSCDEGIPLRRTVHRHDGARMITCPNSDCTAMYTWRLGVYHGLSPADQAALQ